LALVVTESKRVALVDQGSSCGIAQMRFIEVAEDCALRLRSMLPLGSSNLHRIAVARPRLTHSTLDVVAEQLVRIQVRSRAEEKEHRMRSACS